MTSSIKPRAPLLYSSNGNEKKPSESNSIWYDREINPSPTQKNGDRPAPAKLSPDRMNIISRALQAPYTTLRREPEHLKTGMQQKAFQADLSAAIFTKSSVKKTPPIPLPRSNATRLSSTIERSNIEAPVKDTLPLYSLQKNKPKFESASITVPSSLKKRVSFQAKAANQETNSLQILKTLPSKGILKKVLSFRNTEENKPHNEADPSTKTHSPSELNEKPDAKKDLDLAMDELNTVLKNLGIDPVLNFSK